jgi:hypothetical protein
MPIGQCTHYGYQLEISKPRIDAHKPETGLIFDAEPSAELYEPGDSAPTEVVRIRLWEQVTWIHQTFVKMPSEMEKSRSFAREQVMTNILKAVEQTLVVIRHQISRFTVYYREKAWLSLAP